MPRSDGSLTLGEQWMICKAENSNALREMFQGSGYTLGDCMRSNGAALRGMFKR